MLTSDIVGVLASFALLVPAAKDQILRFSQFDQQRKSAQSKWPGLRKTVAGAWGIKREAYSAWDSLFLAAGAFGLVVSFALNIVNA